MTFTTFLSVLLLNTALLIGCVGQTAHQNSMPPEWAAAAVWYQIFPDRFDNGDPANDPQPQDMAGGWPFFVPPGWQVSPWTSDWYQLQPYEQGIDWGGHLPWAHEGVPTFGAVAGLRRYGGDLAGVFRRLDYLQDLGVTALYFNPLFEAPSSHKYDTGMYHHIDNNFGPHPAEDTQIWESENPADPATWRWTGADSLFLELIRECHRRGIKVIIDGVFSHCGQTFWAFQDVRRRQQQSPYRDWFVIRQWDDPATSRDEFDYGGWAGLRDLPEFARDEQGLAAAPAAHIHAVVQRWMDPNGDGDPSDGIDGWRLDVADKIALPFWKKFRGWVKGINPDAYLTGEVWWQDWPRNKMFNAAPWFAGAFDAVMNYRIARAIKKFVIDRKSRISAAAFADSLRAIYRDYPWENVLACMNLIDSHDVDRVGSQLVNPDRWYDHAANPLQNADYDVRKPSPEELARQRLIAALQMTLPGAPMIYYGDECGLWGGDDPDCRKPMLWPERHYQPEAAHPLGRPRVLDAVAFDAALHDWYRRLISVRRRNPALSRGEIAFDLIDDERKLIVFSRILEGQRIQVVVNNSPGEQTVNLPVVGSVEPAGRFTDLMEGGRLQNHALLLAPFAVKILKAAD